MDWRQAISFTEEYRHETLVVSSFCYDVKRVKVPITNTCFFYMIKPHKVFFPITDSFAEQSRI